MKNEDITFPEWSCKLLYLNFHFLPVAYLPIFYGIEPDTIFEENDLVPSSDATVHAVCYHSYPQSKVFEIYHRQWN